MSLGTPIQDLLPSHDLMVLNVLATYEAANSQRTREGRTWYNRANRFAGTIANGDTRQGAGVIAALSPQKQWVDNQWLAVRAFQTGVATGQVFRANGVAQRILDGEDPDVVLSGPKVRAFFSLIADPHMSLAVCVDRHAHDIAVGRITDEKTRKILERKGGYDYVASVYTTAADVIGVLPSSVQAVTWCHWRVQKGIM